IIPTMRREWVASDFIDRAERFRDVDDPRFIKINDVVSQEEINCVVMEYVDLPTLEGLLAENDNRGLEPRLVADVLANVSKAACAIHGGESSESSASPLLLGPLRPNHIYRDKNGKIKISPVHISDATLQSCDTRPMLMLAEDELTSLSPERYAGERFRPAI